MVLSLGPAALSLLPSGLSLLLGFFLELSRSGFSIWWYWSLMEEAIELGLLLRLSRSFFREPSLSSFFSAFSPDTCRSTEPLACLRVFDLDLFFRSRLSVCFFVDLFLSSGLHFEASPSTQTTWCGLLGRDEEQAADFFRDSSHSPRRFAICFMCAGSKQKLCGWEPTSDCRCFFDFCFFGCGRSSRLAAKASSS